MKKILLALGALAVALITIPMFAAFEAHVINVTAKIENALAVQTEAIRFGTVFPEELLLKDFDVQLSSSFLEEDRVDDVRYHIKQKDKPLNPEAFVDERGEQCPGPGQGCISSTQFCHTHRPTDPGNPEDSYYGVCFPSLCPYLSKDSDNDEQVDNDGSIGAFHRAECDDGLDNDQDGEIDWDDDSECTSKYDDSELEDGQQGLVNGILAKSLRDIVDNWVIDLHVPCFKGACAQDNVIPLDYQLDPRLESKTFGCDLWVEVEGVSTSTPFGTITVTKIAMFDDTAIDENDFNLLVGAEPVDSGVGESFAAGVYSISETDNGGLPPYSSVLGGDADCSDGSVTLDPGESISCTITNTELSPT